LLLDTGGLIALLDRSQPCHERFARFFESWNGSVVSSEAVLTEGTHLLGRVPGGRRTCLDFFLRGGAVLVPPNRASLRRCRDLIEKNSDLPMDYADATLVVLAEELGCADVLTTDLRGFRVYRINGRRRFRVRP
jgi:predicted nucleic acid-binding protein